MTDSKVKDILLLVRSAVTGEKIALPEDFDISGVLGIAKSHQVAGLVYYGALNCGVDNALPEMQELFMLVCNTIVISQQQMYEIERLANAFDQNGIDYMLLKGSILRKLYPKIEMRIMGDADILIKIEQYNKISSVMKSLAFEEVVESDHELIWKKQSLLVELHKRLIPSYNKDYHAYYGDGWQLGKPNANKPNSFEMTAEDQMIYLFTHFAKHYRDGGIGIRHFTDLFVYKNANKNMNESYINGELEKLCLYEFYYNICDTIAVWFEGKESTDKTDFITAVILRSGVYGKHDYVNIAQTLRTAKLSNDTKNAKLKRLRIMVFPSLKTMKLHYPCLKKVPVLLPIFWIVRAFDILINKRKKAVQFYSDIKKVTEKDIIDYDEALQYVGLDFNFKE